MTWAAAGTDVRWTAIHRAYPVLIGGGVFLVLLCMLLFPASGMLGFLMLPAAIAVFLGLLSLVGTRNARALWFAHGLVSFAAVMVAMSPMIILTAMGRGWFDPYPLPPSQINLFGWVLFTAVIAGLAGWTACHLERFVDLRGGFPPLGRARWNPRRWKAPGVVGVSVFVGTSEPVVAILTLSQGWNPHGWVALLGGGILAFAGGLILLVCMCWEYILAVEYERRAVRPRV